MRSSHIALFAAAAIAIQDPLVTARHVMGRVRTNQRQTRKDKRRSWAAGNRHAFLS